MTHHTQHAGDPLHDPYRPAPSDPPLRVSAIARSVKSAGRVTWAVVTIVGAAYLLISALGFHREDPVAAERRARVSGDSMIGLRLDTLIKDVKAIKREIVHCAPSALCP